MGNVDMSLISALQWAVARNEFALHYQPQIDLTSGEITGMEALLRWQHPERGLLEPREFLSTAIGTDLIVSIGRWVVEECLREAHEWQSLHESPGRRCELWANVSAVELTQPDFAEWILELVHAAELPDRTLGIEVSEHDLLDNDIVGIDVLRQLHEAGVLLAVDNVGGWYSALPSLSRVPFDAVKLDQRFVRGAGHDIEGDEVAEAIIRLAHKRNLIVVAEGVETWTEGARLCELGADRAHGYLFSPPQAADQARWMLGRSLGWAVPGMTTPDR